MFSKAANSFFMYNIILFLIVNNVSGNQSPKGTTTEVPMINKIIGGLPVPIEKFPFSVKFYNFGSLCAGTIINSWCVLTAAHCFDYNKEVEDMMIEAGSRYNYDPEGDVYDVLSFTIHEDYNLTLPFAADIALIFVEEAIKFGAKSKKAILVNSDRWMNPNEKHIIVTGWGWTQPNGTLSEQGLMHANLSYVTSEDCGRLHQLQLMSDMFCLYGEGARDSCRGDSGGGVIWKDMVIGVVSHGDGCARKDKPSVYTNVWYFRQWIQSEVEHFMKHVCDICPSLSTNY